MQQDNNLSIFHNSFERGKITQAQCINNETMALDSKLQKRKAWDRGTTTPLFLHAHLREFRVNGNYPGLNERRDGLAQLFRTINPYPFTTSR
jgi:hypothetical protein